MDEIITEFLIESAEGLDQVDQDLVALEEDPANPDTIGRLFRVIHTIKGTSGFLGFEKLEHVAHVGETLLSLLRDGAKSVDVATITGLLHMVDAVRKVLRNVEGTGAEGDEAHEDVVEELTHLAQRGRGAAAPSPIAPAPPATAAEAAADAEDAEDEPEADDERPVETHRPASVPEAPARQPPAAARPAASAESGNSGGSSVSNSSVRVTINLLDDLMRLVGELVLARNEILQRCKPEQKQSFQQLNIVTSELQEAVMKTRMQPIQQIWNKLPRVVRDLSNACGKKARLELEGKDTELDRSLLESMKDPLTHIVRNAIDHGIEKPEDRLRAGKPEEGCLLMRAFHESGQVIIEVTDDGRGIDAEKVRAKAVEKGLITAEAALAMEEREAINLIFAAGLTTAAQVTNISGRGVGMDVVKSNIEKIGGLVELSSQFGSGTTLRIKIPLTLAIIPALIVSCRGERLAIAQVNLVELVRLSDRGEAGGIEMVGDAPVFRLRGRLLPLVFLSEVLEIESREPDPTTVADSNVVVVQADGCLFGIVVDEIRNTEEIVVKPLGNHLKDARIYAGATIMGDGRVSLILDVIEIGRQRRLMNERVNSTAVTKVSTEAAGGQSLVIFTLDERHRMAVPLEHVARLEELPLEDVEWTGEQSVIQYRGEIMPLILIADVLEGRSSWRSVTDKRSVLTDGNQIPTIVVFHGERRVGLVARRIIDITQAPVTSRSEPARPGVIESIVIQGRVTEVLDVPVVVQAATGERALEAFAIGVES